MDLAWVAASALIGRASLGLRSRKSPREERTILLGEAGLSEKRPLTSTWTPKGPTPVLQRSHSWKQMLAIAGVSWWRFYVRFFDGAIRSGHIVDFSANCNVRSKIRG